MTNNLDLALQELLREAPSKPATKQPKQQQNRKSTVKIRQLDNSQKCIECGKYSTTLFHSVCDFCTTEFLEKMGFEQRRTIVRTRKDKNDRNRIILETLETPDRVALYQRALQGKERPAKAKWQYETKLEKGFHSKEQPW